MKFVYEALLEADPDGGFLVTFQDVPEAIAGGETLEKAMHEARLALEAGLWIYADTGRDFPKPIARTDLPVSVSGQAAMKLSVIGEFRKSGMTRKEFAERIGKRETEAGRILDFGHSTKLASMEHALAVFGKRIAISVEDAA